MSLTARFRDTYAMAKEQLETLLKIHSDLSDIIMSYYDTIITASTWSHAFFLFPDGRYTIETYFDDDDDNDEDDYYYPEYRRLIEPTPTVISYLRDCTELFSVGSATLYGKTPTHTFVWGKMNYDGEGTKVFESKHSLYHVSQDGYTVTELRITENKTNIFIFEDQIEDIFFNKIFCVAMTNNGSAYAWCNYCGIQCAQRAPVNVVSIFNNNKFSVLVKEDGSLFPVCAQPHEHTTECAENTLEEEEEFGHYQNFVPEESNFVEFDNIDNILSNSFLTIILKDGNIYMSCSDHEFTKVIIVDWLDYVVEIFKTDTAVAALTSTGTLVAWFNCCCEDEYQIIQNVKKVITNCNSFMAFSMDNVSITVFNDCTHLCYNQDPDETIVSYYTGMMYFAVLYSSGKLLQINDKNSSGNTRLVSETFFGIVSVHNSPRHCIIVRKNKEIVMLY